MLKALSSFQNAPEKVAPSLAKLRRDPVQADVRNGHGSLEPGHGKPLRVRTLHVHTAFMIEHLFANIGQGVLRQAAPVKPVEILVKLRLEVRLHLVAYLALPMSCQRTVIPEYSSAERKITGKISSPVRATGSQGNANSGALSLYGRRDGPAEVINTVPRRA